MHHPQSPTEVLQTVIACSLLGRASAPVPPPGSGSGLIVAPPAGWEGRGEPSLVALRGNTKAFSGHFNSSLGDSKVPNCPWWGRLLRPVSPSCPLVGAPGSSASACLLHAACPSAFMKPACSVDRAIQRVTKKVYWFSRNPVLLRCVGNTLMSSQFARVNRDNGFGIFIEI